MPFTARFTLSFAAVSILLITVLLCLGISFKTHTEAVNEHILKSYKNTVALYQNGELVKIYDSVVLNTLPQVDINNFNKGIKVKNLDEIEKILEDYDG